MYFKINARHFLSTYTCIFEKNFFFLFVKRCSTTCCCLTRRWVARVTNTCLIHKSTTKFSASMTLCMWYANSHIHQAVNILNWWDQDNNGGVDATAANRDRAASCRCFIWTWEICSWRAFLLLNNVTGRIRNIPDAEFIGSLFEFHLCFLRFLSTWIGSEKVCVGAWLLLLMRCTCTDFIIHWHKAAVTMAFSWSRFTHNAPPPSSPHAHTALWVFLLIGNIKTTDADHSFITEKSLKISGLKSFDIMFCRRFSSTFADMTVSTNKWTAFKASPRRWWHSAKYFILVSFFSCWSLLGHNGKKRQKAICDHNENRYLVSETHWILPCEQLAARVYK